MKVVGQREGMRKNRGRRQKYDVDNGEEERDMIFPSFLTGHLLFIIMYTRR
jgi:hypothetical protein